LSTTHSGRPVTPWASPFEVALGLALIDESLSLRRARAGVRSWVRSAGAGLRRASPYGVVAFLAASAVAPVAGAAFGASAEVNAALGQLGGMGSNYLSDALVGAAERLRGEASPDALRDALAAELIARLDTEDDRSAGLRDELAAVLRAVGAVEVALREADDEMRQDLVDAFGALGADMGRLHLLAEDAAHSLSVMHQQLAEQRLAQRQQTELIQQSLVATAQLRQQVLGRRVAAGAAAAGPGADPGGPAPYPGMASFDALDARFFRGRETLVAELLGRLTEQVVGGPPLVVVGVSGAGKSSLLRAGVLPAVALDGLGEGSGAWPWLVMTPGATPLAELTGRTATLAGDDPGAVLAAVRAEPSTFGALAGRAGGGGRLIVVVDQFEELFTQCTDPAERSAFAAALAACAPALLIISVRADFYPQCTELPELVDMLGAGQVVVGPLGAAELRRAVREPAEIAGLTLEAGLTDLLLADLGALHQPGALPLLAHALRATWERRDGDTMTVEGYRATGGIRRAVAETAERVFLGLDEAGRVALRRAVLSLVTIVDDLPVRRRAVRSETDVGVLRPMIEARLVTAGEEVVEVSHEALLTSWPRLAGWLVEERQTILLRQRLALAAADWAASGEDPDALYRGARLEATREWAAGRPDVSQTQRRFLAAAESAAQVRELARRRTTKRLRRMVAGLAVALLLAVAGGLVALDQSADARRNQQIADSRRFAAESRADIAYEDISAMTNAIEAWEAYPTPEARGALISSQQGITLGRLGDEEGAQLTAVSPDGRRVAVGYADGRLQLWDAVTLRQFGADFRQPVNEAGLFGLEFSPDGRYLVSSSITLPEGVVIWDAATGRELHRINAFGAVAWLPGSSTLLAVRAEGENPGQMVGEWDPADGRLLRATRIGAAGLIAMAVSRDGAYLAAVSPRRTELVRRRDGRTILALTDRQYYDVGFTPDDKLITITAGRENLEVVAWAAATGRRLAMLSDPADPPGPGRLAITADGTVLVQAERENEIQRLKSDGGGPRPALTAFPGGAFALALSGDGHLLAAAGNGSPPTLVRIDVDRLPHPQLVGFLAYQRAGDLLASGSSDPRIRVWDTRTSTLASMIEIPDATDGPLGLAYGPDGAVAAPLGDGRIVVFGPDGRLRHVLRAPEHRVANSPAISPDGTLLAVAIDGDAIDRAKQNFVKRQERPGPEVLVYDLRTGRTVGELDMPHHLAVQVAFTPDGRQLLATGNNNRPNAAPQTGAVWQWQVFDLRLVANRSLPRDEGTYDLQISPDGKTVAVSTTAGNAALFATAGLTPGRRIGDHAYELDRLAWSPDGRTLATASNADGDPIQLWDVAGVDLIAELRAQGNSIQDLEFSPDGKTLAAASGDWTVALFHLDPDNAVRRLCAVVGPALRAQGKEPPASCR
jgi:WD40 repeat protein